jgi:uncharacterized protein (TIGR02646 family)
MKPIRKQGMGGYHLANAHLTPPTTHEQATSRWSSFAHKSHLRDALLVEQYYLCCYSELRADQHGLGYHIEHVENKSQNPARTFDYTNLAVSALDSSHGLQTINTQGHAAFGGHAMGKRAGVDMARFISCHQPDSQRFFIYLSDGRVIPATQNQSIQEQDNARYTIDLLNLNSPYLVSLRQRWWDELDELFTEHATKNWNLVDLAAIDLVPTNQKLSNFFSMTRQFFGTSAIAALQQQAPGLL